MLVSSSGVYMSSAHRSPSQNFQEINNDGADGVLLISAV